MTIDVTILDTPTGQLSLLARDDVIVAAGFASPGAMAARLPSEDLVLRDNLGPLSAAVASYFEGNLRALDDLPVDQPGGDFHQATWKAMRDVKPGETITYTELATRAGNPKAFRAAAAACARNLIAPIVPCHRILRTGGAIGGYYYGLETKQWLLDFESQERD